QLAGANEIVEHAENFGMVVEVGRWAMQLQQVDRVRGKVPQTVIDPGREVFAAVTFGGLARQTASGFRRYDDFFFAFFLHPRDQALAAAVAINVGSVDKVHTGVDRSAQSTERIIFGNVSPGSANRPCSKTYLRYIPGVGARECRTVVFILAASVIPTFLPVIRGSLCLCRRLSAVN